MRERWHTPMKVVLDFQLVRIPLARVSQNLFLGIQWDSREFFWGFTRIQEDMLYV